MSPSSSGSVIGGRSGSTSAVSTNPKDKVSKVGGAIIRTDSQENDERTKRRLFERKSRNQNQRQQSQRILVVADKGKAMIVVLI